MRKFTNIEDAKVYIKSCERSLEFYSTEVKAAKDYIKEATKFKTSDIVPGLVVEYVGEDNKSSELTSIIYNTNSNFYFLGGVSGNPAHIFYYAKPFTAEILTEYLNTNFYRKRPDLKVDFVSI